MAIQSIGSLAPPTPNIDIGDKSVARAQASQGNAMAQDVLTNQAVTATNETGKGVHTPSRDEVEKALKNVNQFVQSRATDVEFKIDDETGIRVIKVMDRSTKEVIRQIPSEEMVKIAKALDQLQGLLIRQTA